MKRLAAAFKAFFCALSGEQPIVQPPQPPPPPPPAPKTVQQPPPPPPTKVEEPSLGEGAAHILNLLQREGRLVDFLMEDISSFDDSQVGAAARQVHTGCAKALRESLGIVPVFDSTEGSDMNVPEGYDPSQIRVTGDVPSAPPYRGSLRHRGWKASKLDIPRRSGKIDRSVLAPAEVEIQ